MDTGDIASRLEKAGFSDYSIDHKSGYAVVWFDPALRVKQVIYPIANIERELDQLYNELSLAREELGEITRRLLDAANRLKLCEEY